MGKLAGSLNQFNFHGMIGLLTILLMLFHAIWETVVLIRNDETQIQPFHEFCIAVLDI